MMFSPYWHGKLIRTGNFNAISKFHPPEGLHEEDLHEEGEEVDAVL
jgi:hypothetical protein